MATTFRIAHISDLHFSSGAAPGGRHAHSTKRLDDLARIIEQEKPEYLIVSGDLSDRGDPGSLRSAHQWLFGKPHAGGKPVGLAWDEDRAIVVPGNHDAYDCPHDRGSALTCRQRSLKNYNGIFPVHAMEPPQKDCRYHWLEKDGEALYVVAADSSFLGDPATERAVPSLRRQWIHVLSAVARGKFSRAQSKLVMQWRDHGARGTLPARIGGGAPVPGPAFSRSFKILVMHHYLFEPEGHRPHPFLGMNDRERVRRSVALCDFDLLLCGHKHVPSVRKTDYRQLFRDSRSRGRLLPELYAQVNWTARRPRRSRGTPTARVTKALEFVLQALVRAVRPERGESSEDYENRLLGILRAGQEKPSDLTLRLREATWRYGVDDELDEIESRLCARLTRLDRDKLNPIAARIRGALSRLGDRPFVQIMCGSSAKSVGAGVRRRAVNVYDIAFDAAEVRVTHRQRVWDPGDTSFSEVSPHSTYLFGAARRLAP